LKREKQLLGSRYRERKGIPFFSKFKMSKDAVTCAENFKKEIANGGIKQDEHEKCPLCSAGEGIQIAETDRFGIPCKTVICKGCGLLLNDSFFPEDAQESVYKNFYGRINFNRLSPEESFLKRTGPDAYSWKRHAYISHHLGKGLKNVKTVFEVGCRDGCNLLPFHLAGKEVAGCDFDEEYLNAGRKRGMNLSCGGSDSLIASGRKADLIILSHVVEHFIDLNEEIKKIRSLLTDSGYIYVEVPGLLNWNRERRCAIAEDGYRSTNDFLSYIQAVHNYHFDLEKIAFIFEKTGFKMIAGDEWVRAIFRNGNSDHSGKKISGSAEKVLKHLRSVENDYRTLSSQFRRITRKIL